jgi:hypothetical protein
MIPRVLLRELWDTMENLILKHARLNKEVFVMTVSQNTSIDG